ncbi:MAG: FMN-binding protein, partial [Salinispira sp.]
KNNIIYTVIFCFVITFVCVFFLALTNVGTVDLVRENQQIVANRAVLNALGIAYDPDDRNDIIEKFDGVETATSGDFTYYTSQDSGSQSGETQGSGENIYALRTQGPGLWGTIEVVIGFNADLTRFTGLEIINQSETPGLGGRIDEDWFKEQFRDQAISAEIMAGGSMELGASGSGAADEPDDNMIDAITGATVTSNSMKAIVSQAVRDINTILGGDL